MRVLVTGCMGFIGSNLVPYLLNNGCEVIGIDNLLNPSINPTDRMKANTKHWDKFSFWNADIRDLQVMHSIFINQQPHAVVNLAALGSVPRSWNQPGLVTDINERGFINILQSSSAVKVKRVVFASSSSVYGPTEKNVKWEGQPLFPASPYALSKVHNERFADLWCCNMGMEWIGLRFFNVYGPGQKHDSDYSAVIPRFLTGDIIKINGDGLTIRDFTFVEDVCRSIFRAIVCESKNQIVNVGTGHGTNLNKLANLANKKNDREIVYTERRPGDAKISIADTTKLESVLGIKKCISIEDGMGITMEFFEQLKAK